MDDKIRCSSVDDFDSYSLMPEVYKRELIWSAGLLSTLLNAFTENLLQEDRRIIKFDYSCERQLIMKLTYLNQNGHNLSTPKLRHIQLLSNKVDTRKISASASYSMIWINLFKSTDRPYRTSHSDLGRAITCNSISSNF